MFAPDELAELPREIARSREAEEYIRASEEVYREVRELAREKDKDIEVRKILGEYYDKVLEGMSPEEAVVEARRRINELLGVKPAPPPEVEIEWIEEEGYTVRLRREVVK